MVARGRENEMVARGRENEMVDMYMSNLTAHIV